MSQENVELVRDAFQTFSAEGINAALSFFSPDLVWYPTDRWLEGPAYRGHDGMRRLEAAFSENFDDFRFEVHDIRDAQDRVVALIDMTGHIKHSGAEISQRLGLVVSGFRDGTFARSQVGMKPSKRWGCRSRRGLVPVGAPSADLQLSRVHNQGTSKTASPVLGDHCFEANG